MKCFKSFEDFLYESRSLVLSAFDRKFDKKMIYSYKMSFVPTTQIMNDVFDILNSILFDGKLPKINVLCLKNDEIQNIFNQYRHQKDPNDFYALYFPIFDIHKIDATNKNQICEKQYLILNISFGPMTFAFAVSSLCHEMIHYYDTMFGDVLYLVKKYFDEHIPYNEHETNIFINKMKIANLNGLTVVPDDDGVALNDLNKLSTYRFNKMISEIEKNVFESKFSSIGMQNQVVDENGDLVGVIF